MEPTRNPYAPIESELPPPYTGKRLFMSWAAWLNSSMGVAGVATVCFFLLGTRFSRGRLTISDLIENLRDVIPLLVTFGIFLLITLLGTAWPFFRDKGRGLRRKTLALSLVISGCVASIAFPWLHLVLVRFAEYPPTAWAMTAALYTAVSIMLALGSAFAWKGLASSAETALEEPIRDHQRQEKCDA